MHPYRNEDTFISTLVVKISLIYYGDLRHSHRNKDSEAADQTGVKAIYVRNNLMLHCPVSFFCRLWNIVRPKKIIWKLGKLTSRQIEHKLAHLREKFVCVRKLADLIDSTMYHSKH